MIVYDNKNKIIIFSILWLVDFFWNTGSERHFKTDPTETVALCFG
jgi:hypothetical protein